MSKATFNIGDKVFTNRIALNYRGGNVNREKVYEITKIHSNGEYELSNDFRTSYLKRELIKVTDKVIKGIVERKAHEIREHLDRISELNSLL